jgi:hypothetical protein
MAGLLPFSNGANGVSEGGFEFHDASTHSTLRGCLTEVIAPFANV